MVERSHTLSQHPLSLHLGENSVLRAVSNRELLGQIKWDIKSRLVQKGEDFPANARDLVAAAGTLECWLVQAKGDQRKVETIPPPELDSYLAEFFPLLKRRDGADYDPGGFSNFRSSMDHYLIRKKYPASLRHSKVFSRSQSVFKFKRKCLSEKPASRPML